VARPNVVIFISDQQRADTMPGGRHAAGIRTPHVEWLAQRGTLFRNAFCVTPMCSPARASLLSGYYPHTTGMVSNHQEGPISDELHLSSDVRVLGGDSPNDLSISLEIPEQCQDPRYVGAVEHIISVAAARGVAVGPHCMTGENAAMWRDKGARFMLLSSDWRALAEGYRPILSRLRGDTPTVIKKPA